MGNRSEGITGRAKKRRDLGDRLDRKYGGNLDRLVTRGVRNNLRRYVANAEVYANLRVRKGLNPTPKFIVGPVGFTDRKDPFIWSWLPPTGGAYRFYKGGKRERPWTHIVIHSFGYSWDRQFVKLRRAPPGDAYGSHPSRMFAGINQLCARDQRAKGKASIHAMIARNGNIIMSVDINDVAYHAGTAGKSVNKRGTTLVNAAISRASRSNNTLTVGIELEPRLIRVNRLENYTDRQMLSFAIFCKKLMASRDIAFNALTKDGGYAWDSNAKTWSGPVRGSLKTQSDSLPTGFVEHLAFQEGKLDARGQFAIAPGSAGSGWDQLFGLIHKLRFFNLNTEVWADTIPDISKTTVAELASVMLGSDGDVKAVLQTQWDSERGFMRAASVQAQGRRTHYKNALGENAAASSFLSRGAATITKAVTQKLAEVVAISGDIPQYNFNTGLWSDGNPQ